MLTLGDATAELQPPEILSNASESGSAEGSSHSYGSDYDSDEDDYYDYPPEFYEMTSQDKGAMPRCCPVWQIFAVRGLACVPNLRVLALSLRR